MRIRINNKDYTNPEWNVSDGVGTLKFESDELLSELEQEFGPDIAVVIEEYNDGGELVNRWYNRKLCSIAYKRNEDTGVWKVTAEFNVSSISFDENTDIRQSIEDSDDALFELAVYISALEEAVDAASETLATITSTLTRTEQLYNSLADRVARLENKGGN